MDNIYILKFQRPSVMGCNDIEIRICRAKDMDDAEKIAQAQANKYFKGWSITISYAMWNEDGTAYVYCDYR